MTLQSITTSRAETNRLRKRTILRDITNILDILYLLKKNLEKRKKMFVKLNYDL